MKKITTIVLALVLMFALATSALALTANASYKDGVLSWNVTDYVGTVGVYVGGSQVGAQATGTTTNVKPGDVVTFRDLAGNKDTFTVPGAATEVPVTEAPTATPAPTEEPTVAPTEEPTQAPTQAPTTAPTQRPTARPTKTPSSDVPKTGDSANAVYVMGGLMLLAGACLVLSRKVSK
jgi:LPXTG-motif cell wall-anchored protein